MGELGSDFCSVKHRYIKGLEMWKGLVKLLTKIKSREVKTDVLENKGHHLEMETGLEMGSRQED